MKNKAILATVIAAAYFAWGQFAETPSTSTPRNDTRTTGTPSNDAKTTTVGSYSAWRSGQQVQGSGRVVRILSDDNDGSRHQRFIIEIDTGRTLLIAHNIDLAPRVAGLRIGDTISFNGEFEPNDRGGVIHWTHLDPRGSHVAGWIEHKGRKYQ